MLTFNRFKHHVMVVFPVVACMSLAAPAIAQSTVSASEEGFSVAGQQSPLVIIRFNQRNVYFEQALANALAKAKSVKPTASYTVLLTLPPGDSKKAAAQIAKAGNYNLARVVTVLRENGISDANIRIVREESASVGSDEVRVFIQ